MPGSSPTSPATSRRPTSASKPPTRPRARRCAWSTSTAASSPAAGKTEEAKTVWRDFDKLLPRHPAHPSTRWQRIEAGKPRGKRRARRVPAGAGRGAVRARRGRQPPGRRARRDALPAPGAVAGARERPRRDHARRHLRPAEADRARPTTPTTCVPPTSPLRRSADIQIALNLEQLERKDEAVAQLEKVDRRRPEGHRGADARSATSTARARTSPRRPRSTRRAIDAIDDARQRPLGALLLPRHRLRAHQAVAEGGGRLPQGAGAVSRPAAGAQLSRLFLGRPEHEPRRGLQDAEARGRAAADGRLHRRQPRLGLLPARPLRRGGAAAGAGRRAEARPTP